VKGIVKWYNARKGYGFITPDDKSEDVFVHATALKDCGLKKLFSGSEVSFETDQDDKGKRAKSIKVTKEVKPTPETKEKTESKTEKKESKKTESKPKKKDSKKKEASKPKKSTQTKGSKKNKK